MTAEKVGYALRPSLEARRAVEDEFYSPSMIIRMEQIVLVRQVGCVRAAVDLFSQFRATAPGTCSQWAEWDDATLKMTVAAKAFIYEAATLRQLAVDVVRRYPQFALDADRSLADFDQALPMLMELRNSQAHLDERLNFRARGKGIKVKYPEVLDPHGFGTITLPHVSGQTIQSTTESGEHAVITVDAAAVAAAEKLVRGVFLSLSASRGPPSPS